MNETVSGLFVRRPTDKIRRATTIGRVFGLAFGNYVFRIGKNRLKRLLAARVLRWMSVDGGR